MLILTEKGWQPIVQLARGAHESWVPFESYELALATYANPYAERHMNIT